MHGTVFARREAMKRSDLTADYVRSILEYNQETGALVWKVAKGRVKAGCIAGRQNNTGYLQVQIDRRRYLAHRLVWLIHHESWPKDQIDHIDGCRTNNRVENLREATRPENHQNRAGNKVATSRFLGVTRCSQTGKWAARICIQGKTKFLGRFHEEAAAAAAYAEAKATLHTFNPTVRTNEVESARGVQQ